MLLTAGERISIALLCDGGDRARARRRLAHRLPGRHRHGRASHGKARIVELRPQRVHEALDAGKIVIVAGFQGVSTASDITTLGRGGSDTTAVALAAALDADVCEIYTDVDGVFTADPRVVPDARKLDAVTYEEMLELAASARRVLALRSVEYARTHGVAVHVRSSFGEADGTWIVKEEDVLEQAIISGIAHDSSEAKVTILGVPDKPGVAGRVFRPLADAGINIDMIVQNVSAAGRSDISFTLPQIRPSGRRAGARRDREARRTRRATPTTRTSARCRSSEPECAAIPGVAADMFEALADAGINIEIISTSSIRISCVVTGADLDRAVQILHERFELSAPAR